MVEAIDRNCIDELEFAWKRFHTGPNPDVAWGGGTIRRVLIPDKPGAVALPAAARQLTSVGQLDDISIAGAAAVSRPMAKAKEAYVRVGIIGYGIVGQATADLFGECVIYDPPKGYSDASLLRGCRVIFMTVPTPPLPDGRCDLSALNQAAGAVARLLSDRHVIAVRSTVTPGTVRQLQEQFPNTHFASNPEFLRAHRASEDALRPARVVIGADSVYARQTLLGVYYSRLWRDVPYLLTDSLTAEFIKYAANCFLATKITYAAAIRRAADAVGARYADVVKAIALDPRIGGGEEWFIERVADECLPKDLEAFVHLLRDWGLDHLLLERVLEIKDRSTEAAETTEAEIGGAAAGH